MTNYVDIDYKYVNTDGTTAYETFSVILPIVLCTFISANVERGDPIKRFFAGFFIVVIPSILIFTLLVEIVHQILTVLLVVSVIIYAFFNSNAQKLYSSDNKRQFVTNARSAINILTAIAILAVDFPIFPRRFAKTEKYGYSLMDVGVGLFVYSNGIVAPEIKGRQDSFSKTLKNSFPLIVLGCIRWFVTKEIDYHVPVSEYGIHWNFFITLAVTKIVSSFILTIVNMNYTFLCALAVIATHECLLQIGLAEFVFKHVERSTFLLANREGIVSALGYVALHFFSVSLGKMFYDKKQLPLMKLFFISLTLLLSTFLLQYQFGISRKLSNSAYCAWVLFIGSFMTCLFCFCEILQSKCNTVPLILEAINYNGLTFFLVANLLTGFVNIVLVDTFMLSPLHSLSILILYMFLVTSFISLLYSKGVKLKL